MAQHPSDQVGDWELISIAVEHAHPEAARSYAEPHDFRTAIDAKGELARQMGFQVVPNGVLIDEEGIIRWAKFGGFSIDNEEDTEVVERFLAGADPGPSPDRPESYTLAERERELVASKVQEGRTLLETGRREDAVATWQEALHLDPGNFTIRKQIWSVKYPEKFYPTIDFDWQGPQLEAERAAEIAAGYCGPDGCPIPTAEAVTSR